jgi:hypothetical protein
MPSSPPSKIGNPKSKMKRSPSEATPERSTRFDLIIAVAFNLGLAMFVVGCGWYLVSGPSTSWAAHWARVGLCSAGLAVAGPAWIAGLHFSTSAKLLFAACLVSGVVGLTWSAERDFFADDQVLQPWRREGNRLVHDGLGLSVALLPGWNVNPQPVIANAAGDIEKGRTRLWFGESAVFLMMAHEQPVKDKSQIGSSLIIRGGPETFGSYRDAMARAHDAEEEFGRQEGAKILSPTRVQVIHGMDVLMFEGSNAQEATFHQVFFRSGSYLLHLEMWVVDRADRAEVMHFLNSIEVNGRNTDLLE